MALNINANQGEAEANAPQQNEQKDQPMNQPQNTGFGAPPQDMPPQNVQQEPQQPQNPPQQGGFGGQPNQPPQQDPNMGNQQPMNVQGTETHHMPPKNTQYDPNQGQQPAPQQPEPQHPQGGGFANTFGNQGGGQPPQQGGFGNQQPAQNQGGGFGQQPPQQPAQQGGQAVPANLMKTGAEAYQAFQNAQQSQGSDRRFFLKQGEERTVIFLDGDLDGNGFFTNPVTREHTVKMGNKFQNILCLNEQEPCPLCQLAGENSPVSRASFVCYFTVLDRTGYTDQQGNRHADFVSIYVAKTNTLKQLQAFAKKFGGLRGQEMTITRTHSNNAPRVGDMFIPGQKWDVQNQIIPYFTSQGRKADEFKPFDYSKAITYYSADQLRGMGFNDGHFSGTPSGMGGGMNQGGAQPGFGNQQPQNTGGFGGQPGNSAPPANPGGFGSQPQNQGPQGGFGGQPQQNTGGFNNQQPAGNPAPTSVNHDFSQDI